ncbi:MAG: hypothetical protein ACI9TF_001620 [Paracrocinitomix sp.]|jgi:hypothetical protein
MAEHVGTLTARTSGFTLVSAGLGLIKGATVQDRRLKG